MTAALLEVLGEATALLGTIGAVWVIANFIDSWRIHRRP